VLFVCLMFVQFVQKHQNSFRNYDGPYLLKAGGLLNHTHPDAGYFNAGEKLWFWGGLVALGLLMGVTGLVLDFGNFGQTRYVMQIANYLHIAGATFFIVGALGHIYLGTIGTPGAFHAMYEGTVDTSWAKSHHRLWYEEVKDRATPAAGPAGKRGELP